MIANPCEQTIFGYLSTVESADHGFFGGYLLISNEGRPLEFHCTAPFRPSRAQQILYGPTLRPYLLGEQIGGILLASPKLKPNIILTDQLDAFYLRPQMDSPLVLLASADRTAEDDGDSGINPTVAMVEIEPTASSGDTSGRVVEPRDSPVADAEAGRRFRLNGYEIELPPGYAADHAEAVRLLQELAAHVDLAEPFARIHEAIREAQRIGGRERESDGQAA